MWNLISQLSADHIFVLAIIAGGLAFFGIVTLGPVIAWNWRAVREREAAMDIVHAMLEQGSAVDEIERVLRAGGFGEQAKKFASMKFGCRERTRHRRSAARSSIRETAEI